ncbi:MAG: DUF429 domain-containing protein [Phycisphaeraceae bacterium]|nr:DUF429 domain-containing protein [Phycisphaeraceae bacterium]
MTTKPVASGSLPNPGIGIDGCRAGWLMARTSPGREPIFGIEPEIDALIDHRSSRTRYLLIDMPIGLPGGTHHQRTCDRLARRLVGPRRSSIFSPPARSALAATDYQHACALNFAATGRKISRQTWNIMPRIAEVDARLRREPSLVGRLIESHPEACFAATLDTPLEYPKKSRDGIQLRIGIIKRLAESLGVLIGRDTFSPQSLPGCGRDDLIDALVLSLVSLSGKSNLRWLDADPPEHDETGLPMRMAIPAAAWVR